MPHSRLYSWSVLLRRLARIRWLEQFLHRASRSTAAEPPGRRRTGSDDHGRLDRRDCRPKRRQLRWHLSVSSPSPSPSPSRSYA